MSSTVVYSDGGSSLSLELTDTGCVMAHAQVKGKMTKDTYLRWLAVWEGIGSQLVDLGVTEVFTFTPADDLLLQKFQTMFGFSALVEFEGRILARRVL